MLVYILCSLSCVFAVVVGILGGKGYLRFKKSVVIV